MKKHKYILLYRLQPIATNFYRLKHNECDISEFTRVGTNLARFVSRFLVSYMDVFDACFIMLFSPAILFLFFYCILVAMTIFMYTNLLKKKKSS